MPWPFSRKSLAVLSQDTDETSSSASTRFAFRLFRELVRSDEASNLFFSPSSVMMCLTMVHELASGETRRAMTEALEIASLDAARIEAEIAVLKTAFRERVDAQVAIANSLWLSTHSQIATELATKLRRSYQSELTTLDFSADDAVGIINAWVDTQTRSKIRKIVDELSPLAALIAINAVYFKGAWVRPFPVELTRDGPFTAAAGHVKQLSMMLQSGTYRYYEDKQLQMAVLPYEGDLSMVVVLPALGTDGKEFSLSVSSGSWESWFAQSRHMEGTIQLPRFRVDCEALLKSVLSVLGMRRAFDPSLAQFEAIQAEKSPIWIDEVIHRAMTEVNEEGTEAAAVTGVFMPCMSAMNQKPRRQFSMIVNRPFFVVIRDEATKTILFMGWIADPR
ncbi:MAG: serpin family protein [Candidatus Sulfotelmatobacter sp.]|jgi:serpin B